MNTFYLALADMILVVHMGIVLFVIGGFMLTWIGYFVHWTFVRNFYFRIAHLLAMGFVAAQTVLGIDCPLTVWENALRVKAGTGPLYEETFIGHWLGRILFYEAPSWVFTVAYAAFFGLIVLSWIVVKPGMPRWLIRKPA